MDYVKSLATNLINRRGTERPTSQGSSYAAYQPHFPPSPFTPPTGGSSKEQQAFYVAPTYPPPSSASPSVPVTVQRPWAPLPLRTRVVLPVILIMIAVAVGLEVVYAIAIRQNGFKVGRIDDFGGTEFLSSFVPVIIALPFSRYWSKHYEEVLRLQPYVTISQGHASPRRSVLLDYMNLSRMKVILTSLRLRDFLVFFCTIIYLFNFLFQPLAAALFVIKTTELNYGDSVQSVASLGLRDDFEDLNAFSAAAGYVQAAIVHGLSDPPFVWEGWSMAAFDTSAIRETITQNATIIMEAVATSSNPHCAVARTTQDLQTDGSYLLTGSYNSCQASVTVSPTVPEPFGLTLVDDCYANGIVTDDDKFKPVMFWFFSFTDLRSSMILCQPSVEIYNVIANISVADNLLQQIDIASPWIGTSNVTSGPPLEGLAMNGLYFDDAPNEFVSARAVSIRSGLPGSIFRSAERNVGISAALQQPEGMLQWVNTTYRQYLAISAKSNFYLDEEVITPATFVLWEPRLFLDMYATHLFAALFVFFSVMVCFFHVSYRSKRRRLRLASEVGSIASVVALTSSSPFGAMLNAGDTEADMERKLKGMTFGLDERTGAIVVDGSSDGSEHRGLLRSA